MKATQILMEEHRLILKALECLQKLIQEGEEKGILDKELGEKILTFIRHFADQTHHGKEEDRLFVVMGERGFPLDGGPIGCMLEEHQEGRSHVSTMFKALEGAGQGKREDLNQFIYAANQFIPLLQNHIQKEDQVLFPMAEANLGDADMAGLERDFKEIESREGQRHRTYINLLEEICHHMGIPMVEGSEFPTISKEFLS